MVSGIIVMREGQNALDVIERVKAKIKAIEPGLPSGVQIVPIYDRSDLIQRAISNMKSTLVEVLITVSLVILIFLWHFPSAIIPVITIPVAVLISFIPVPDDGGHGQHHVPGGYYHRGGGPGGRGHRHGGAGPQETGEMAPDGPPGGLPGGHGQGGEGGGGAQLLCACW